MPFPIREWACSSEKLNAMRLLYVIDSIGRGGAETSLGAMAAGLTERGVELHVLPLDPNREHQRDVLEAGGAVIHQDGTRGNRAQNMSRVVKIARAVKPNLIHTTLFEADIAGRTAALIAGIPSSSSIVSDSYGASHYQESNRLKLHLARALDAATSVPARRFHAITEAIADNVAPRLRIPRTKIEVIPRGRDPQTYRFRPDGVRAEVRRSLGIADEAFMILAVGRHEPPKGLQHLLRAVSLMPTAPTVVIAGREGRSTPELTSLTQAGSLDVRFLGHRSDVADLLAAADAFCFPSEREGFGGVLIEAMAAGCPIVASDIPTTVEVLGRPGLQPVGRITPTGDSSALASALASIKQQPRETDQLVHAARAHFDQQYTIDAVSGRMADFFRRAAAR